MEINIHKIKENLKLTKEHWAGLGLRHWGGVLQAFGFGALAGNLFLSFGIEADSRVYEVILLVICTVLIVVGQFIGATSDWRKSLLKLPVDVIKISVFSTKDCRIRRGLLVEADAKGKTVVFDAHGKERGPSDCVVEMKRGHVHFTRQTGQEEQSALLTSHCTMSSRIAAYPSCSIHRRKCTCHCFLFWRSIRSPAG